VICCPLVVEGQCANGAVQMDRADGLGTNQTAQI
jgi:hypothetical protein